MSTYPFLIPSGTNIVPEMSGSQAFGTAAKPFSNIYSDRITETSPIALYINSGVGYGAVNNKIRRIENTVYNYGNLTLTNSADSGTSITINTPGLYSVFYMNYTSAANTNGISINSTQLTTAIQNTSGNNILAMGVNQAAQFGSLCATQYFPSGTVLRPHDDGSGSPVNDERVQFRISKVG